MSKALVDQILNEHFKMQDSMIDLSPKILNFAQKIVKILKENGTVFWCGNGGSASDSQHLAAELVGRFEQNRPPLKSISLNTDTSIITALSNDFSYEMIFERQLDALATSKDLLIVISTSGNSKNIIRVLKKPKKKNFFCRSTWQGWRRSKKFYRSKYYCSFKINSKNSGNAYNDWTYCLFYCRKRDI